MTDREKTACEHNKECFLRYWEAVKHRGGADRCLQWLENETDFFTAPASRKYHGNHPGGLLRHSLTVCEELIDLWRGHAVEEVDRDSVILVALLHDVCKCNFYKETAAGEYEIEDALPMGHGEKSLYMLLQTGLQLTDAEAAAIRWHMGAYNDQGQISTLGKAFDKYPLALFLHLADMIAAHYYEVG